MKALRATLHDPMGPRWLRLVLPLVSWCALAASCSGVAPHETATFFAIFAACAFLASRVVWRIPPREVNLEIDGGRVYVRGAGLLRQTLKARNVVALSTTRTANGVAIALARTGRCRVPLTLHLANDADATAVREALGVGSHGYGYLEWIVAPRRGSLAGHMISIVLGVFACGLLVAAMGIASWIGLVAGAIGLWLMRPTHLIGSKIYLDAEQIRVPDGGATRDILFSEIASVSAEPEHIAIRLRDREEVLVRTPAARFRVMYLTYDERTHLVLQIAAAVQRARGAGTSATPDTRFDALRQNNQLARDWITRLDMTAEILKSSDGYRGAGFSKGELWRVAESPDSDVELRAAAARILNRVEPGEAKARIASALATIRDDHATKRIRIVLQPDPEVASVALDAFDVQDLAKNLER